MIDRLIRNDSGVIENKDDAAYNQYIAQRKMFTDMKNMREEINILRKELSELKQSIKV